MRSVFVETNFLFDIACPTPFRTQDALDLLRSAHEGDARLLLPAPCFVEARKVIRNRFQNPKDANRIRQYLAHERAAGRVTAEDDETVRRVLRPFEDAVAAELEALEDRLRDVITEGRIEVVHLTQQVLERSVELSMERGLDLNPFDNAILGAVLVTAENLRLNGETDVVFAEKDKDLQAVNKDGSRREPICSLYDAAHLWVFHDFTLRWPERPTGW